MHFISALSGYENAPLALLTKPLQFLPFVSWEVRVARSACCLRSEAACPVGAAGYCGHGNFWQNGILQGAQDSRKGRLREVAECMSHPNLFLGLESPALHPHGL